MSYGKEGDGESGPYLEACEKGEPGEYANWKQAKAALGEALEQEAADADWQADDLEEELEEKRRFADDLREEAEKLATMTEAEYLAKAAAEIGR
jgi:hypothetical protein